MKKKVYGVFGLIVVLFAVACISMLRITGGSEYVMAAGQQSTYRLDVAQSRGTILDCNYQPLVRKEQKQIAAIAPSIEAIGKVELATQGENREALATALKNGKPFTLDVTGFPETALDGLPGIDLFQVPQRYGEEQLAPHIIGYIDGQGQGVAGVELAMNDVLAQNSGEISVFYRVDALGRALTGADRLITNTIEEHPGGVVLTLDGEIQALAEKAAASLGKGAVVVTQVPNCEIRGLASVPSFSPNDLGTAAENPDAPLLNRAFSAYAPGSVFKLVTAAVALEQGTQEQIFACTGSVVVEGLSFHCINSMAHGKVNLAGALEKSCNCYFIQAAQRLGGQRVLTMAYNLGFGVGEEFGRGLLSEAGTLPQASSLTNLRSLANFSFGQGELTVTPLQVAAMVNTIASGGLYAQPQLIVGVRNSDQMLTPHNPLGQQSVEMLSPSTATTLQAYMKKVVQSGTGKNGAPESCVAGAKTGTAQTGIFQGEDELLHFWYAGFIQDSTGPTYCITVLQESGIHDQGLPAKAFREVADGIMALQEK